MYVYYGVRMLSCTMSKQPVWPLLVKEKTILMISNYSIAWFSIVSGMKYHTWRTLKSYIRMDQSNSLELTLIFKLCQIFSRPLGIQFRPFEISVRDIKYHTRYTTPILKKECRRTTWGWHLGNPMHKWKIMNNHRKYCGHISINSLTFGGLDASNHAMSKVSMGPNMVVLDFNLRFYAFVVLMYTSCW